MGSSVKKIPITDVPGARVLVSGLTFLESPRFAAGEIFYSDGAAVRASDLQGRTRTVAEIPTRMCLGVHVVGDDAVYTSAAYDRVIYKITGQGVTVIADLSQESPAPLNEFVVLPGGNLLVASMGFDLLAGETPQTARLLLVTPDGSVRETGPDMLFANGMVLGDDAKTLWVVESGARQINKLSLDQTGEVIDCVSIPLRSKNSASRPAQWFGRVRTLLTARLRAPGGAVSRVLTPVVRIGQRMPGAQAMLMRVLPLIMRHAPDGLAVAADGSLWYADMMRGAAVCVGDDGVASVMVDVNKRHASSCVIFEADGQEWLGITAADTISFDGAPEAKTAELVVVPLAAVLSAAQTT